MTLRTSAYILRFKIHSQLCCDTSLASLSGFHTIHGEARGRRHSPLSIRCSRCAAGLDRRLRSSATPRCHSMLRSPLRARRCHRRGAQGKICSASLISRPPSLSLVPGVMAKIFAGCGGRSWDFQIVFKIRARMGLVSFP